ncbi:polysaccharide deacetylase family protein [Alteromonas sediminis]|nr:polysaccharide deacetylase family protein [Alteromonas sediminis]
MKSFLCFIGVVFCFNQALANSTPDQSSTVGLIYHHVATDTPPSTSVSPETFREHMAYIKKHFTVLPLQEAINKIKKGIALPPQSLVITFDDGYRNILENAHPILKEYGFSYTIFINPDRIGVEPAQLTWEEVRQMEREGVLFANHTIGHLHLLDKQPKETDSAWLDRVWRHVEQAQETLEQQVSYAPKYLAYPFGEYNALLAEKVLNEGYVGFAQHSGGISALSDFAALPRFPSAGIYANMRSLETKMKSLAMPVVASTPIDPELSERHNVTLSFTINSQDVRLSQVQCFYRGKPIDSRIDALTVSARVPDTLPEGRSRVNCTAPSNLHKGRFYWYSQPFFVAREDGTYPD